MIRSLKTALSVERIRSSIPLFDNHPLPTWIADPEDFRIILANKSAVNYYGYTVEEFLHHNFLDFFSGESRILFFQKAIQTDISNGFNDNYLHFRKDGTPTAVSLYSTSFVLEGQLFYQFTVVDKTRETQLMQNLEAEKQRYQTYIENSTEGIFCQEFSIPIPSDLPADELIALARPHSYIAECNDVMAQMYGYEKAADLTGVLSSQLLDHNVDANRVYLRDFIENGFRIMNRESQETDRYGNTRFFLNSAIGIVENGFLKRIWGTQQDITEKKKTDEKLRLLANMVEQTSDILTAADLQFRPITWSQSAERVYGISADQVIGRDIRKFVTIHYHNTSREEVRMSLLKYEEWRGEAFFVRPTDKKMVTLWMCFKLMKDHNQQPLGYLVSATDITERKEAEFRLKESENRFRDMADSAPVMIWMSDEKNRTVYLNKQWLEFTGTDITGSSPEGWAGFVHSDDIVKAKQEYDKAFVNKEQVALSYRLRTANGTYRWVHDVSVPRFLNDGTFIGFIGSVVDIEEQKQRQEQLLYQATVLENVSDIIFTTGLDYSIQEWNKAAEQYYELSEEEVIGRRIGDVLKFSFYGTTEEEAFQNLQQNGFWEGEVSRMNSKGEVSYFLHTVKFLHDGKGMKIGYLAVGRDITEKKKIEEQLLKSEQFYRTLIADAADGMLLLTEQGNIDFCSPSVKKVLGYEVEELIGKNGFSYVHPDDLFWAFESFQKEVFENPEVKSITVRLLKKSGEWIWCSVRGHNLLKNPFINNIVVYFHDDTLRKQANDALRESERRFRDLIRDLQIGVFLTDSRGNVTMVNAALANIASMPEEELIGKNVFTFINGDAVINEQGKSISQESRPLTMAIATKEAVKNFVIGITHPVTGQLCWFMVNADPILDEQGNVKHIVCSMLDITERKKMERQLLSDSIKHQKELTQATFDGQENERREIGKELHDNIGQQLTTIKLFLDIAKTTADDTTNEMISMGLKGVSDVINEVRAMSRSLVPYTLKDLGLVESINELADSISRTQLLKVCFDHHQFEEENVRENQKLTLYRIVQEQLNNIVKHAKARNVCISLKRCHEQISLEITDDGVGFEAKNVRKGLGFINMRNRAELFGGEAKVVTKPGKGCRLTVSIPFNEEL